jgi:iron complex transport system substrate-binding protein
MSVTDEMRTLSEEIALLPERPAVLFALQLDAGAVLAAGRGPAADAIISPAGEAVLNAAPAVVLTMDRAVTGFDPPRTALALPVLAQTPAAANDRLVVMDGLLLLGFGPRLALAARELALALHGAE